MEKHISNAKEIVDFLVDHPKVKKVNYPGLEDFVNHEVAKEQMNDYGAMISFEVEGGLEAGKTIMNNVKLCSLAVSLGDAETLIEHPASMTHSTYSPEDLKEAGIDPGLVRLSPGLEDAEDIIKDLKQAIDKIK